jgi:hypothetical protein
LKGMLPAGNTVLKDLVIREVLIGALLVGTLGPTMGKPTL